MPSGSEPLIFSLWNVVPFVLMLLSIAILPIRAPHWWGGNGNKLLVSIGVSIPTLAVLVPGASHLLIASLMHYFSFMVLMGATWHLSPWPQALSAAPRTTCRH